MSALASQFPGFGYALRKSFAFDVGFTPLNHGGFGATPRPVIEASNELTLRLEANPDAFIWLQYDAKLNEVRRKLAKIINADVDECVLVPNVCNGINTVLRNFEWKKEDVIIITNCTFNPIGNAARHISQTPPYPSVLEFALHFPEPRADLLQRWRGFLRRLRSASDVGPSRRRAVAIIDSIVSGPGLLMPWREMVQVCREENVWSAVDAAHSLGQEPVDLGRVQPDFWVSSCSKWLFARRGCAVLYVPKRNQYLIKSALPTQVHAPFSPDTSTFGSKFAWFGSLDVTIALSIPAALQFRESLGGDEKINAYCHALAVAGGKRLAEMLGTRMLDDTPEHTWTANMCIWEKVAVQLPLPAELDPSFTMLREFQTGLIGRHKIYASPCYHHGWWMRASAQVYNEMRDFERLGYALLDVCRELGQSRRVGAKL